jgi:hypothetical protein
MRQKRDLALRRLGGEYCVCRAARYAAAVEGGWVIGEFASELDRTARGAEMGAVPVPSSRSTHHAIPKYAVGIDYDDLRPPRHHTGS